MLGMVHRLLSTIHSIGIILLLYLLLLLFMYYYFFFIGVVSAEQWRCSKFSDYLSFFPDFGDSIPDPLLWQDSMRGISYVYPIPSDQINCSGIVTDIQYCYRTPTSMKTNVLVFTLLTLNQIKNSFYVTRTIAIHSSSEDCFSLPTNSSNVINCTTSSDNTSYYCCGMKLSNEEVFEFPATNLAIGIAIPNSSIAILQEFSTNLAPQVFTVPSYKTNSSLRTGSTHNLTGLTLSNQGFQILRLHISK